MEKYLKMSDLFEGGVTANHGDEYNGWSVVETSCGLSIDESGDGGFEAMTADYVAHAINTHDELVAMNKELLAVIERVIGSSEKFDKVMGTSEWADGYKQCAIDTGEALRGILDAMKAKAAS